MTTQITKLAPLANGVEITFVDGGVGWAIIPDSLAQFVREHGFADDANIIADGNVGEIWNNAQAILNHGV
tara:strand:+ start:419 stop:628 length:210 start_codon:yes stop_codon:yes gene_type:complete